MAPLFDTYIHTENDQPNTIEEFNLSDEKLETIRSCIEALEHYRILKAASEQAAKESSFRESDRILSEKSERVKYMMEKEMEKRQLRLQEQLERDQTFDFRLKQSLILDPPFVYEEDSLDNIAALNTSSLSMSPKEAIRRLSVALSVSTSIKTTNVFEPKDADIQQKAVCCSIF